MNLPAIDLSRFDFGEIGGWPRPARIAIFIAIGVIAMLGNYFLLISKQITELTIQHNRQISLREEFRDKYHKAVNLDVYKKQMEIIKKTLHKLFRQLPAEGKVPSLMEEISLQANAAGLEFKLIKPGNEMVKKFYTELPIKMAIVGSYRGFGRFISEIAKLPRIVTLHDFAIKVDKHPNADAAKRQEQTLLMDLDAKTYWGVAREHL